MHNIAPTAAHLDPGRDLPAGTTPRGEKVHHHQLVASLLQLVLELVLKCPHQNTRQKNHTPGKYNKPSL